MGSAKSRTVSGLSKTSNWMAELAATRLVNVAHNSRTGFFRYNVWHETANIIYNLPQIPALEIMLTRAMLEA
jgi:hypothetical protein